MAFLRPLRHKNLEKWQTLKLTSSTRKHLYNLSFCEKSFKGQEMKGNIHIFHLVYNFHHYLAKKFCQSLIKVDKGAHQGACKTLKLAQSAHL